LFAVLAFEWGKSSALVLIISLLGLVVALLVFIGMLATATAIVNLQGYWNRHKAPGYEGLGVFEYFPAKAPWTAYTSPEVLLPIIFPVAWLSVIRVD
jgi:hypothetical protein